MFDKLFVGLKGVFILVILLDANVLLLFIAISRLLYPLLSWNAAHASPLCLSGCSASSWWNIISETTVQLFGPISSCFLPEKTTISILEKYPKILTSVKGTTHKPGCGVKVIPSQCNRSQQFSNMVVLCFLGIFSKSFCGNQVKCFVILSDVVLSACALGSTLYTFLQRRQKCVSFLIKLSLNTTIICQAVCLKCIHMSTSLNGAVLYLIWFRKRIT